MDQGRMRVERRQRVLAGMAEEGIDALLLGTGANIRYATGARPLWLAGTRPWAPLAAVLRDGESHLVASSDDGVPPDVPHDHLLPASWNPAVLVERLAAVIEARTIGVDGLSPMFEQLLRAAFPEAQLVDATPMLHRARATKTEDEIACIRRATAIGEAGLQDVVDHLSPRVTERALHARFVERMAMAGSTIPAFDGTFLVSPDGRVVLDVGVMFQGYEGGLARTWHLGAPAPEQATVAHRARDVLGAVLDGLRPGEPPPEVPDTRLYGVGLGVEPLATDVGSTLCVEVRLDGALLRETVVLRPDGPELLSRFP